LDARLPGHGGGVPPPRGRSLRCRSPLAGDLPGSPASGLLQGACYPRAGLSVQGHARIRAGHRFPSASPPAIFRYPAIPEWMSPMPKPKTSGSRKPTDHLESILHENRKFAPTPAFTAAARIKPADFKALTAEAKQDNEGFWARQAAEQ